MVPRAKIEDVVAAFEMRGFQFTGRSQEGWHKLSGQLQTSKGRHDCEVRIDPHFFEYPEVRLLKLPPSLPRVTPHLGSGGYLCYIAKGTVVLDIFDPVGQALACLERAEEVLDSVLKGHLVDDLAEEFYAYWNGPFCLLDIQQARLGKQETLVTDLNGTLITLVTDDTERTKRKLLALGWKPNNYTMPAYRVRTTAQPRPNTAVWPPKTVRDILEWQGLLDPRCRKKIQERIVQARATGANGVLILVESPLMTYGFGVQFEKYVSASGAARPTRGGINPLKAMPMSVVRIDDRYIAERNAPGLQTLAGKRLVLVGCGTIGGFLAEMLVKAGAGTSGGQLTLIDSDALFPQNIGRHRLGFPSLFKNKAIGLAEELSRLAPGVDLRALPVDIKSAQLNGVDLLIDATGEEALGHWLCEHYLPHTSMLSVWIEGPGTAVRALLHTREAQACYRCLYDANRRGQLSTIVGALPQVMAGQGCEGLYVPFSAAVSVQAASLGSEMALAWANGTVSPALRTKLIDMAFSLATPDCDPVRNEDCPACHI